VMMSLHFTKQVPFKRVYVHALVRDEKGQKMSKSKGNVIDPLELINRYGADSIRFTLADLSTPGRDVRLSEKRVQSNRNFITKVWNAARFLKMHDCKMAENFNPFEEATEPVNLWISNILVKTANQINEEIEEGRFDNAAHQIFHFTRDYFCDWYLEFAKQLLTNEKTKQETAKVAAWCYGVMLQLLNPFAPLVTEHLWQHLGREDILMDSLIDLPKPKKVADEVIANAIECIKAVRALKSELGLGNQRVTLAITGTKPEFIKRYEPQLIRLAGLAEISSQINSKTSSKSVGDTVGNTVPLVGFGGKLHLAISGDIKALIARLDGELTTTQGHLAKIESRLNNKDFTSRAAPEVVQTQREQKEHLAAIISDSQKTLKKLRSIC